MHIQRSYIHHWPLIIDGDALTALGKLIETSFKDVKYKLRCVDNAVIHMEKADQVIHYENPSFRKIKELVINGKNSDGSRLIIRLRDNASLYSGVGDMEFEYKDLAWGGQLEKDLIQRLRESTPGIGHLVFSFIPFWFVTPLFVVILLGFVAMPSFPPLDGGIINYLASVTKVSQVLVALLVSVTLFVFGLIVDRLRNYIMPASFIAIGKQVKEYERRSWWANFVLIGVVCSIVVGVITNLLSSRLFGS